MSECVFVCVCVLRDYDYAVVSLNEYVMGLSFCISDQFIRSDMQVV